MKWYSRSTGDSVVGLRGNVSRIGVVSVLGGVFFALVLLGVVFAREKSKDDGNRQLKQQVKKISGTVKNVDSRRGFIVITDKGKVYRLEASSGLLEKFSAGERVLAVSDGNRIKYIRRIEGVPPAKKPPQTRQRVQRTPVTHPRSSSTGWPSAATVPADASGRD